MRRWLLPLLAAAAGLMPLPASALVPYVYVPSVKELNEAGLGIAGAAAGLLQMGQAEEARRLAELAVQVLPNDPRAWLVLAEAQLRSDKADAAAVALGRAKQLNPSNPGVWFAEGALNLRKGKAEEAQRLIREGLRLDGNNAAAYFDLGNAQIQLGDLATALGSFEKASGLRRNFWEAVNNQGIVLYELGQNNEAVARWRKALELSPGAAEPTLALAAALYTQGRTTAETVGLAVQALAKEPDYALDKYQKDQLWGERLRRDTQVMFRDERLRTAVDRAQGLAGSGGD
ncbi:MAG: tetratricopeptide repeat protein [Synechococcus sp.]